MKESVKRCCVLNCSIDAVVVVFGRLVVCMYGLLTGVAETNVFVALIEGTYEFSELDAAPEYELESGTLKLNGAKPILEDVPKKGFGKGYPETWYELLVAESESFNIDNVSSDKVFLRFSLMPYGSKRETE